MVDIGSQIAQYKVLSVLGTGGMGTVYLAEDSRLGRMAALKFLAPEFASNSDHLERFIREARSASSLNHPNICTIYDIVSDGPSPYIAMEFVEGESLSSMIAQNRRNTREVTDIVIQVADALHEAHQLGLVHRDVKPSNIIISPRGRAKLLDFGLAKQVELPPGGVPMNSVTRPGMILGTAPYMSPEQARGLDLDPRTDVWSLGVSMFEAVTGQLPFSGETVADTLAKILTADVPSIKELNESVEEGFISIVGKALAKKPSERYASSAELLNDLRTFKTEIEAAGAFQTEDKSQKGSEERTQYFANATTEFAPRAITGAEIRSKNLRPNNLSRVLSPIIGREREITEIIRLLQQEETRLLTLTGVGGTGKTKLARSVAEEVLADFQDGVYFIELSSITDPELVVPAIAKPLGIDDGGSRPVFDNLLEYLKTRELLLILDNFEQVIAASDRIAALLESTERLKILITSRTLLRLAFGTEFPVPPLALPDSDQRSLSEIRNNEAIRLFETRAKAVKPSFGLTDGNVATIVSICSQLDGLPLAIELAAARIRILTPEAILARLDDRLKLLSGGSRDLPDRHRTIRDMIEWSYELLDDDEKVLFRRLAVFSGTFTVDLVEAICGPAVSNTEADLNVLDSVAALAEHNLISERSQKTHETRFRMLGVVRDHAVSLLQEAGEYDILFARLAAHYANSVEKAEPLIQTASPGEIFRIFEIEHDNIRAALKWSFDNDTNNALRIVVALRNFWLLHGHLTEGFNWLTTAAANLENAAPEQRFKIYSGLGLTARFRGQHNVSRKAYESGLESCIEAGDKQGVAAMNRGLGLVAMQQNVLDSARQHFETGLKLSRELGDDYGIAMSLSFLGDLARVEKNQDQARKLFEEASALFRTMNRKVALGDSLNNLGTSRFLTDDPIAANESFAEAARIAIEIGNKITLSHSLDGFGALRTFEANLKEAAKLAGAAESLRESLGYKNEPAELAFRESYLEKVRHGLSREDFESAYAEGVSSDPVRLAQRSANISGEAKGAGELQYR